jgi:Methyltransferase domain
MPLKYTTDLGTLARLRDGLALRVRRRVFDLFMRECAPTPDSRVADFGVSGHQDHPVHYFFETLYPYRDRLTVIGRGAEDAGWFPQRFPGVTFLEADLRDLPLPDRYFDAGLCNAVVEHAGTRQQQSALVREICRVCKRAMFTTPNKRFPVELHTFLPVLHWLPDAGYRRALRVLGLAYFADVENLNLLDASSFLSLFPPHRRTRLITGGLPLLPSNLICISTLAEG